MKIEYTTSEYEFNHSKTPKGRGSWSFQLISVNGYEGQGKVYHSSNGLTLAQAKKQLKPYLIKEAQSYNSEAKEINVNVLP